MIPRIGNGELVTWTPKRKNVMRWPVDDLNGGSHIPIDKPFPCTNHFADGRTFIRVWAPTLLNEPPHLCSEAELFRGLWLGGSFPIDNMNDD